jgi:O-antigen/teichoic acid export membrane protein
MTSGIRRKAGFLAAAGLLEYAAQMALPVILVRHLTAQEFGDYRLIWLVATTGLILFPLFLPQSCFISCRALLPEPGRSWWGIRS